ncbi:MAG: hypothetical protein L0Y50_11305 [Beijerinckiaceae bacterium]|nr:hypothetical protein [Beijerinckiaceae bacterium]MCI0736835.1 hypothetical protein [Beijerinckiaceae bacterium]
MKKVAALSILIAITAGCAKSPEEIAAELRADEARCRSLGFQLGSDSFKLCLLNLQQGRQIYKQGYDAGYSAARSQSYSTGRPPI